MQFSLKKYLAIGLGITAIGTLLLHESSTSVPQPVSQTSPFELLETEGSIENDEMVAAIPSTITQSSPAIAPVASEETESQLSILDSESVDDLTNAPELEVVSEYVEDTPVETPSKSGMVVSLLEGPHSMPQVAQPEPSLAEAQSPVEAQETGSTIKELLKGNQWRRNPFITESTPAPVPQAQKTDEISVSQISAPTIVVEEPMQPELAEARTDPVETEVAEVRNDFSPVEQDTSNDFGLAAATPAPEAVEFVFPEETLDAVEAIEPQPKLQEPETFAAEPTVSHSTASQITPLQMPLTDAAAQQAAHHIEYGKSLSRRGAAFAARHEFIAAMRVLAQHNDTQSGGNEFSESLQRALIAMKEAKDFMIRDEQVTDNVARIIESHRSGIITAEEATSMSAPTALQKYLSTAERSLDMAGGRNVVAAEALYCLGKLHTTLATSSKTPGSLDIASSVVFHRASLKSDAANHRSANELGVLMARSGRLGEAKKLFKQSLRIKQTPETWINLAKTHERMGETKFAQMAERESYIVGNSPVVGKSSIQWVNNQAFNSMQQSEVISQPMNATPANGQSAPMIANAIAPGIVKTKQAEKKQPPPAPRKSLSERLQHLF